MTGPREGMEALQLSHPHHLFISVHLTLFLEMRVPTTSQWMMPTDSLRRMTSLIPAKAGYLVTGVG